MIKSLQKGFTLIELLVVIAIIALMIGIAIPNYVSSRARARDSKKKQELLEVKTALRLYYNDYGQYPAQSSGPMKTLASMQGCGTNGISSCQGACPSADFAAGGSGCDTVYMRKLPFYSPSPTIFYYSSGSDFRIAVTLENLSDPDLAASWARCPSNWSNGIASGASCSGTTYCVCAE